MVHPCPGLVEPAGDAVRKKAALLHAALAVIENGDAKAPGVVGEIAGIAGDAGAGEDDDGCGRDPKQAVIRGQETGSMNGFRLRN